MRIKMLLAMTMLAAPAALMAQAAPQETPADAAAPAPEASQPATPSPEAAAGPADSAEATAPAPTDDSATAEKSNKKNKGDKPE